jgi:drug/metabolite transporter (DMT)-like permease
MQHNTLKGIACVMLSVFIWSGWMVVSRFAVKGSLMPADITAIRFTTAGLLLLPIALRRGLSIGPWGWRSGFLLSLLIGAPYTLIATAGMMYAPASHASTVINGTLLVLTTVVGIHGLREETSALRLAGVLCSLIGIVCMLVAKSAYGSADQWIGHLLFVVSGLLWGGYTLLARAWRVDAKHAAAAVCVFAMISYMPFYLLFVRSHIGLHNWQAVAFQAVYQGLFTGVIAFVAFNTGIHILGALRTGAFIPLVPVISTLLAIPVLGEVPTLLEWTGVASVSFGVFLASGILHWRPRFLTARMGAN